MAEIRFNREFDMMMVGESGCGKTSLLRRFTCEGFERRPRATLGAEFSTRVWREDNRTLKLRLWDTPGAETHRHILPIVFRKAHAVLLVFDLANRITFLLLPDWMKVVEKYTPPGVLCFVLGTKLDLEAAREVPAEDIAKLSLRYNVPTFEVSSLSGEGVEEAMYSMLVYLDAQPVCAPTRSTVELDEAQERRRERGCCGSNEIQPHPLY